MQWSTPGYCSPSVQCPIAVPNGHVSNDESRQVNAKRFISCNDGYRLVGNSEIVCLRSGQRSPAGFCQQLAPSFPTTHSLNLVNDFENIYPQLKLVGLAPGSDVGEGFDLIKTHLGSWELFYKKIQFLLQLLK